MHVCVDRVARSCGAVSIQGCLIAEHKVYLRVANAHFHLCKAVKATCQL